MQHDIYTIRLILICIIVSGLPFKDVLMREKGIETQSHLKINCLAGRSFIYVCFWANIQFPVCVGRERKLILMSAHWLCYNMQCMSSELKITARHVTVHPCLQIDSKLICLFFMQPVAAACNTGSNTHNSPFQLSLQGCCMTR